MRANVYHIGVLLLLTPCTVLALNIKFIGPCGVGMDEKWEDLPINDPIVSFEIDGLADGSTPKIEITDTTSMSYDVKQRKDNSKIYDVYKTQVLFNPVKEYTDLSVTVENLNSGTTEIDRKSCLINLTPINRYAPEFSVVDKNSIEIDENKDYSDPLIVLTVTDQDMQRHKDLRGLLVKINNGGLSGISDKFKLEAPDIENCQKQCKVEIRLAKQLDYEERNFYNLDILVTDKSEKRDPKTQEKTANMAIMIYVKDVHDQPPRLMQHCGFAAIKEHIEVGKEITQVKAVYGDTNLNNKMEYTIDTNPDPRVKKYFTVEKATGKVKIKESPDRESDDFKSNSAIKMFVKVTEINALTNTPETDVGTAESECNFNIEDIDDCKPQFNEDSYISYVDEHSTTSVKIDGASYVEDLDQGENAEYNIEVLVSATNTNKFAVTPTTGINKMAFYVQVTADLDYDDKNQEKIISFKVKSTGKKNTSQTHEAKFVVNIRDINDNYPDFGRTLENPFNVYEHADEGTVVTQLRATDKDSGAYGTDGIVYEILSADYEKNFNIDKKSGIISLKKNHTLDREKMNEMYITVAATDNNGIGGKRTPGQLKISILDINDQHPVFRRPSLLATLDEESDTFQGEYTVEATDADLDPPNNTVNYKLKNYEKFFSIGTESGTLTLKNILDFELDDPDFPLINLTERIAKRQFFVEVVAYDLGNPASLESEENAIITVDFMDINDHSPNFTENCDDIGANASSCVNYVVEVEEHFTGSGTIFQMSATDKDKNDFGEVNYKMYEAIQDSTFFSIDKESGNITLKGELDYEKSTALNPVIIAFDNPRFLRDSMTTDKTLRVIVIDINDNAPEFKNPQESCQKLREDRPVDFPVGKVVAEDKDEKDSDNSRIEYSIIEGNDKGFFRIDSVEGGIYLDKSVSNLTKKGTENHSNKHNLVVLAQDFGAPRLSSNTSYCIVVEDCNINKPYFTNPANGKIPVESFYEVGKGKLVYTVEAMDMDLGVNGEVIYELKTHTNFFGIGRTNGEITAIVDLKKTDEYPEYRLEIEATDNSEPFYKSEINAKITILIKDETDERPHFNKSENNTKLEFTEHFSNETVTIPKASYNENFHNKTDLDMPIYYFIIGSPDEFILDQVTGELRVRNELGLDREVQATYEIEVQARSTKNPLPDMDEKKRDIITLHIILKDINDQRPVFAKATFTAGMSSDQNIQNTSILRLEATDADEGEYAVISFTIISKINMYDNENLINIPDPAFTLNKDTGDIVATFSPGINAKAYFEFTVKAEDIDGQNDTAVVLIYLKRSDQMIVLTINKYPNEVTKPMLDPLITSLSKITNHHCNLDGWSSYSGANLKYQNYTDVRVHFVDKKTNKILEPVYARRLMNQYIEEIKADIQTYGIELLDIPRGSTTSSPESFFTEENLKYMLIGASGFLLLSLIVAVTIFVVKISGLKRNLKAATATAFGSHDSGLNRIGVVGAPNTNQHMIEGSNPIYSQDEVKCAPLPDEESDTMSMGSFESDSTDNIGTTNFGEEPDGKQNPAFVDDELYLSPEIVPYGKPPAELPIDPPVSYNPKPHNTLNALKLINSDWRRRATEAEIEKPRKSLATPEILNLFDAPDKRRPSGFVPTSPTSLSSEYELDA